MIETPPAISLLGVGVLREQRWILRDIDWTVPAGACAAILGPNGSGKSTLTRVIAGQLWPTRGDVRVLGEHFGEVDLHKLRRGIRLVQSNSAVEMDGDLTAFDIVLTGYFGTLGLYDPTTSQMREEAEQMLELVGLHAVAHHRYNTLSTGERMRSLIARSMVQKPRLLMLDEPTSGLDLLAREQVLAAVEAMSIGGADRPTVLMITHRLEELPPAVSQVLLMNNGGAAAQGKPGDVLRAEVLSPVYGCPMRVTMTEGRYSAHVSPNAWQELLRRRVRSNEVNRGHDFNFDAIIGLAQENSIRTRMATIQSLPMSAPDLDRLQDEAGVEFVNGQILEKPVSIESSLIEAIVNRLLGNAAAKDNVAHVFGPSMGYQCFAENPAKFRKPDVSVVRAERMLGIDPKSGFLRIPPDLAVEVLSPNDLASDISEKVEDYIRNGVALVWVIDPTTRTVMVRKLEGAIFLHERDEITAAGVIPEFRCKVAEFFPTKNNVAC